MIIFTPFMIFTIYQWSLRDSWLTTLLSVMSFLLIFACIFYPTCLTLHLALRNTPYALYTHGEHLNSLGPLFSRYRTPRYYFFTCILVGSLLKAILVASLKEHGQAQVALMLLAELGILLSHVILRPFKSRGSDILAIFIAMIRFVAAGLLVAFVEGLSLAAIPRVVVGVVIAILYSIAVIVMLLDYLIQAVREVWSSSIRRTHSHQEAADKSVPDKGSPLAFGLAPGLSSCGAPSQSSEQNATMSTQLSSSSEPPPNEVFTLSQVTTDR
jgi:hypothetical protein